ncbi:MAG: MoaD/ThiS family protein [Chloroflexota bacterium]
MSAADTVRVELFGMARLRAGRREVVVPWRPGLTLGDLPAQVAAACPVLQGRVVDASGGLAQGLVFNLNGRDFLRDPATPIQPGASLLLLSADGGG